MLYKNARLFIESFFRKGRGGASELEYFDATFVEPPGFGSFLEEFIKDRQKPLLIEGQGRAGKTWTAVAAAKRLLELGAVDAVLTAGEDSRQVYDRSEYPPVTVAKAIEILVQEYQNLRNLHQSGRLLVFLDDFIGSGRLRQLGRESGERERVARFLFDNAAAVLAPEGGDELPTVLFTTRSTLLATAAILLDRPLASITRHYLSYPRGIYRREYGTYRGDNVKELTDEERKWIDELTRRNQEFIGTHPGYRWPALCAFSELSPEELRRSPETGDALFGYDLRAIETEVVKAEWAAENGGSSEVRDQFDITYLLYVAPGLSFPTRALLSLIGRGAEDMMRYALKLTAEPEGGLARKVPNEFYLDAVRRHLGNPQTWEVLARVLFRVRKKIAAEEGEEDRLWEWKVLLRGLLEVMLRQCAHRKDQPDKIKPRWLAGFCNSLKEMTDVSDHDLLALEMALLCEGAQAEVPEAERILQWPGLASTVGWLLQKILRVEDGGDVGRRWADTLVQSTAKEFVKVPIEKNEKIERIWPASYSNLVRWIAHVDHEPREGGLLDRLLDCCNLTDESSALGAEMRMVVEDAVIWCDCAELWPGYGERDKTIRVISLPAAKALKEALEREEHSISSHGESISNDWKTGSREWVLANRLFSVLWHNEWMDEGRAAEFGDTVGRWLQTVKPQVVELIHEDPAIIESNLQYHWVHLRSQWSTWVRDWCFVDDPIEYERERAPLGICKEGGSRDLIELLLRTVKWALEAPGRGLEGRNAFFLLATRISGPDDESLVLDLLLYAISCKGYTWATEALGGLTAALWELGRQGYLGVVWPAAERDAHEARGLSKSAELKAFFQVARTADWYDKAWRIYRGELYQDSYLESLPSMPQDVEPEEVVE